MSIKFPESTGVAVNSPDVFLRVFLTFDFPPNSLLFDCITGCHGPPGPALQAIELVALCVPKKQTKTLP